MPHLESPLVVLPLVVVGFFFLFAIFWCIVSYLLALMGWQRLAADYRAEEEVVGLSLRLRYIQIGSVSYQSVVKAQVSTRGLGLRMVFLFRVGHAPLLLPWAAIEPFKARKFLWHTTYHTTIRTAGGGAVRLQVSDKRLPELAQPYL